MHQINPMFAKERSKTPIIPSGAWPVGLTAFTESGCIDWDGNGHLLDWYVANGAAGIFTVCLSGEMYFLDEDERLGLAEFTRARLDSNVSVVAAAGFGDTFTKRVDSIKRMADTGVDAVVVPACQLVSPEAGEKELQKELQKLFDNIGNIKLGLYECPLPYHRLLKPETLGMAAASGKVLFLKDTSCDIDIINRKLENCSNSGLQFFNANTNTTLDSFNSGAAGYCGTGANFFPELYAELWSCFENNPEKAEKIQLLLNVLHRHVCYKYPRSAKAFLRICGVNITDYCRWESPELTREEKVNLKDLHDFVKTEIKHILN